MQKLGFRKPFGLTRHCRRSKIGILPLPVRQTRSTTCRARMHTDTRDMRTPEAPTLRATGRRCNGAGPFLSGPFEHRQQGVDHRPHAPPWLSEDVLMRGRLDCTCRPNCVRRGHRLRSFSDDCPGLFPQHASVDLPCRVLLPNASFGFCYTLSICVQTCHVPQNTR